MDIHPPGEQTNPWGGAETPFEEIGGDEQVRRLASVFYDVVDESSPTLDAMLPNDTTVSRQKLYEFLSGWMGGPPLYWERRGHPALRMRHAPFAIDDHAAEEWARCMREAIDRVVESPALRSFLDRELSQAASQLRNQVPRPG